MELSGLSVTSVREDGPAASALSPADELLAIDAERLDAAGLPDRLANLKPGRSVRLLVGRDGRVMEREIVLGQPPAPDLKIVAREHTDSLRSTVRDGWLAAALPRN